MSNSLEGLAQFITYAAAVSNVARYEWHKRGRAPVGYVKGMALVFARAYCRLSRGDAYALEMAKAETGRTAKDAMSHYAKVFQHLDMQNQVAGPATLRHLFVLLLGLGMRESSGRWCTGRDKSARNITSDTSEAGLFQTSWNAHSASPLLQGIFNDYRANPNGFLEVFKEGVPPSPVQLENFGSGEGSDFQRLSKECPAFAAEFAAIGLRNVRTHWGPINREEAEVLPAADEMFSKVQEIVDSFGDYSAML